MSNMAVTAETQTRETDDAPTNHRALLDDLVKRIEDQPAEWQKTFIATIAAWPIENETVHGETFHYFIGGEAFNWKRLAERIATELAAEGFNHPESGSLQNPRHSGESRNPEGQGNGEWRARTVANGPIQELCKIPESHEIFDWIANSGTFGGLKEQEFRRTLGVDGWRAHLNHFYGVHIEQCLLAAVQSRIQKQRYSKGMPPSDDASDRAFMGLYEDTEQELWQIFTTENAQRLSHLFDEAADDTRSIALDEEFTYWLFKRRIENTNAPQIAAETQRGLDMMARITDADERRARLLKDQNGGALLEFGLVKRRNGTPITP